MTNIIATVRNLTPPPHPAAGGGGRADASQQPSALRLRAVAGDLVGAVLVRHQIKIAGVGADRLAIRLPTPGLARRVHMLVVDSETLPARALQDFRRNDRADGVEKTIVGP